MNAIPPSISRTPEDMALDAHALFQEGLVHLRRLAGKTWTDHNVHDPGITVLELATWALAEFGYRVSLPLEDLLSPPDGDHPALDRQFHRARQVLPVRPFTTLDWRKRLIDLPGVKNAWVEPVAPAPLYADLVRRQLSRTPPAHPHYREVILQGLYRVRVDFMDTLVTLAEQAPVLEAVRHCLETQRNLGEDFVAVEPVPTQRFALCAEVDLQADADVTETAARLLFAAARGIAPAVPSHALATLQRRPWPDGRARSVQEIFDGPLLEHGFIDETELIASELPTELHLSDLINILMDVPGVRAIPDILLTPVDPDGTPGKVTTPWRIPVASGHLPRLALEGGGTPAAGRLTFRKRGMPVAGWELAQIPAPVRERLRTLQEEARQSVESPFAEDLPLPTGRHRAVDAYRSFQLDFPALYGLGPAGLAGPTDPQRQVQVLQFKAWLTFFDQQIANDLALLGQVRHRLSVAPEDLNRIAGLFSGPTEQSRVLATQMVTSIPGYERLYAAGTTPETLAAQQESAAEAVTRQQRLLNHLLARIGEDFSEYAGVMASAFGHPDHQVIADTCRFLADAPTTTAHRAGAYDQSSMRPDALWNSLNVSGLEIRLARLLGIADFSRRNLGAVSYDTYAEVDATPGDEFRFRILRATDHKILLSSTGNFTSREAARARMIEAIERGQQTQPGHYRILEGRDGRFYFRVLAADGRVLARRVEGFATRQAAEDAVAGLSTYLREHYSGEGLYMFENLLLRPAMHEAPDGQWVFDHDPADQAHDDPFLPICVDPDCTDCADTDPYSWRLQIILPAYAGRFQNMDFRRFVEQTIRQEVPAHLLPRICWVNADDMARFEGAYRDWLLLHAGASRPNRVERHARLNALVDALTGMKNQYPQRRLFDCTAEAPSPPFVLGQTALGSAPDTSGFQETDHD